jgi:ParB family chromosome partitioning protein
LLVASNAVPLDRIRTGPELLRNLDEEAVEDLARSIAANGLLQPILVRPVGNSFEIVFGHHRVEACKRLHWQSIPAIVKEMSVDNAFLTKIVENIQRNNEINPLTEAKGYVALVDHGWTVHSIAHQIGKSDSYVSDRIGLIRRLHPEVARKLHENHNRFLKPSHAELLARIKSKKQQLELSELIEQRGLSVRELELLVSSKQPLKENVQRREDSLYVRIPQSMALLMGIDDGSPVYVFMQSRKRILVETATDTQMRGGYRCPASSCRNREF